MEDIGFNSLPSPVFIIGRLVFPILLFLFAYSFHYTRSRKKLMTRLLLMSWLMSIGNIIIGNLLQNGNVVLSNNAFSTFLVVAILDCGWDRIVKSVKEKSVLTFFKGFGLILLPVLFSIPVLVLGTILGGEGDVSPILARTLAIVMLLIPNLFTIEGGLVMVLLGWVFYIFRSRRNIQLLAILIVSLLSFRSNPASLQWVMVFSILPLFCYNGEKGRGDKYFFYIFYQTHIYFLYLLASFLH